PRSDKPPQSSPFPEGRPPACYALPAERHVWRLARSRTASSPQRRGDTGQPMTADQAMAFADLLRRRRVAAGLTQEALAERAGLSARAISDLERGLHRHPHRDTVQLIADALELPLPERGELLEAARRRSAPLAPRRADLAAP